MHWCKMNFDLFRSDIHIIIWKRLSSHSRTFSSIKHASKKKEQQKCVLVCVFMRAYKMKLEIKTEQEEKENENLILLEIKMRQEFSHSRGIWVSPCLPPTVNLFSLLHQMLACVLPHVLSQKQEKYICGVNILQSYVNTLDRRQSSAPYCVVLVLVLLNYACQVNSIVSVFVLCWANFSLAHSVCVTSLWFRMHWTNLRSQ